MTKSNVIAISTVTKTLRRPSGSGQGWLGDIQPYHETNLVEARIPVLSHLPCLPTEQNSDLYVKNFLEIKNRRNNTIYFYFYLRVALSLLQN